MNEEFDLDQFDREFEESWTEDDNTQDEETVDETVDDVDNSDVEETIEEESALEEQEETPPVNDPDTDKRNRAFADMRRQNEELQKQLGESGKLANFLKQLAEKNGTTPEELMQRYEERQLEEQAERENVPVDVLKRLQALESENKTVKQQAFAERFQSQVDAAINKFGASDDDVRATFQYALENGIDFENTRLSFEAVYQMAHHESIVQKAIEQSRQQELSQKRKRQETSAIPSGTSNSQVDDDLDAMAAKDAAEFIKQMGF